MSRRRAKIRVSYDQLAGRGDWRLELPNDAEVVATFDRPDMCLLEVVVSCPRLPEVDPGAEAPVLSLEGLVALIGSTS